MELTEKLAGVVREVNFRVTLASGKVINSVVRKIDYSNLTLGDALALADSSLIIKMQRTLRSQTEEVVVSKNGAIVDAADAGKAPETPETLINKLRGMGLTAEQITELVNKGEEA